MGKMGKFNFRELKDFEKKLKSMKDPDALCKGTGSKVAGKGHQAHTSW